MERLTPPRVTREIGTRGDIRDWSASWGGDGGERGWVGGDLEVWWGNGGRGGKE